MCIYVLCNLHASVYMYVYVYVYMYVHAYVSVIEKRATGAKRSEVTT